MTKLDGKTPDLAAGNIEQLRQIFPDVFEEGKIDFDKLKQVLGEYVDDEKERYNFTWNGKGKALRLAQTPTTGTLRPCEAESKNWDDTQNLYIEGDNLEVLKLLQKSYHGKIKMIFIDPPYNTGGDFIYPDNFSKSIENYKQITGQVDGEGKTIGTNTEANGRYHTDWLNMMYPRLRLARNLLNHDGVIFISIDDNEHANLKEICDEVFGGTNFIGDIVWRSSDNSNNNALTFSEDHNYILVYSKDSGWRPNFLNDESKRQHFKNPDNDPRGPWFDGNPVNNPGLRPHLQYDITTPSGKIIKSPANGWRWSWETIQEKMATGEIRFSEDETRIIRRTYLNEMEGLPPSSLCINLEKTGHTRGAKYELKNLFPEIPVTSLFSTPKPSLLIKYLIEIGCNNNGIILDFFSGSGTTADAVMQQNCIDEGTRKFILVQLPEPCSDPEGNLKNICEIGKERIRRAGEKIKAEVEEQNAQLKIGEESRKVPDIGFKVFKLDSSNLKQWQPDYDDLEATLFDSIGNYVDGRSELDVVYEIMLKMGMELTWPLETHTIGGKNVYEIGMGALMICLDNHITTEVTEGMAALYKELAPETWRVVFKDNGFADDSAKVNIKEILKTAGLEEDAFTTV